MYTLQNYSHLHQIIHPSVKPNIEMESTEASTTTSAVPSTPSKNVQQKEVRIADMQTEYSYKYFDVSKLRLSDPVRRDLPAKAGAKGTYCTFDIKYDYGTESTPKVSDFFLEGPQCYAPFRLGQLQDEKTGELSYSIMAILDVTVEEYKQYYDVLLQIYRAVCRHYTKHQQFFGVEVMGITVDSDFSMFSANREFPFVKCPIQYPKDKTTKRPDYTRKPSITHKVNMGKMGRTSFTDYSIPPLAVSTELLQHVPFYFIPCDDMSQVYVGSSSKAFIQNKMKSSIIVDFGEDDNATYQGKTIHAMNQSQADKLQDFQSQIKKYVDDLPNMKQIVAPPSTSTQKQSQQQSSQVQTLQPPGSAINQPNYGMQGYQQQSSYSNGVPNINTPYQSQGIPQFGMMSNQHGIPQQSMSQQDYGMQGQPSYGQPSVMHGSVSQDQYNMARNNLSTPQNQSSVALPRF